MADLHGRHHSSYDAGEINDIRSLLQRSDGWMWG
jgi:hypothetical protein